MNHQTHGPGQRAEGAPSSGRAAGHAGAYAPSNLPRTAKRGRRQLGGWLSPTEGAHPASDLADSSKGNQAGPPQEGITRGAGDNVGEPHGGREPIDAHRPVAARVLERAFRQRDRPTRARRPPIDESKGSHETTDNGTPPGTNVKAPKGQRGDEHRRPKRAGSAAGSPTEPHAQGRVGEWPESGGSEDAPGGRARGRNPNARSGQRAEELRNRPREHARLGDQTAAHPTFPRSRPGRRADRTGAVKHGGSPRARGNRRPREARSIFKRATTRGTPAFPAGTERREGRPRGGPTTVSQHDPTGADC